MVAATFSQGISMARGWESKSIESQQEEAARDRVRKPVLTPEQLADAGRRRTLELTRTRVADDLSRAKSPHHRAMLERSLAAIDDELARLH
jgi:hypothetical protein